LFEFSVKFQTHGVIYPCVFFCAARELSAGAATRGEPLLAAPGDFIILMEEKVMKKFTSMISMLAILLAMLAGLGVSVSAAENFMIEEFPDFAWVFADESKQTLEVFGYYGAETIVTVPAMAGGYPVVSIGDVAFAYETEIRNILLPDSVRNIGRAAFSNCTGLIDISLPDSLISIGDSAFRECIGLTDISLPDKIKNIGESAFLECAGLKNISFPSQLESIGDGAFWGCTGLVEISLPDNLKTIDAWTFAECTGLESIVFPNQLETIGESAFRRCTGLAGISLPDNLKTIDIWAFCECTGLTDITIPVNVDSIGNMAFFECANLKNITVLNKTVDFVDSAFPWPWEIDTIHCYPGSTALSYAIENDIKYKLIGTGTIPLGQVSGGEILMITDARMVLQHLVGKITLTEEELDVADVDGDAKVTIADARLILQMLVGKIDEFPRGS